MLSSKHLAYFGTKLSLKGDLFNANEMNFKCIFVLLFQGSCAFTADETTAQDHHFLGLLAPALNPLLISSTSQHLNIPQLNPRNGWEEWGATCCYAQFVIAHCSPIAQPKCLSLRINPLNLNTIFIVNFSFLQVFVTSQSEF